MRDAKYRPVPPLPNGGAGATEVSLDRSTARRKDLVGPSGKCALVAELRAGSTPICRDRDRLGSRAGSDSRLLPKEIYHGFGFENGS